MDINARMKTSELRKVLQECLDNKQAVYEVVAVIGTTEEGAVDRLADIVKIRDEFMSKGLTFVVHADAAWGGYFASMLPPQHEAYDSPSPPSDFVPHIGLRCDTEDQLCAMKSVDSITLDPHKAGYVPYPAGSLCYRDGRMRYLLTWTAPYINQGSDGQSIGVYGVEGRHVCVRSSNKSCVLTGLYSKPGAAAAAVYLSNCVIGLDGDGMGSLLGEASFTCRRVCISLNLSSCHI